MRDDKLREALIRIECMAANALSATAAECAADFSKTERAVLGQIVSESRAALAAAHEEGK